MQSLQVDLMDPKFTPKNSNESIPEEENQQQANEYHQSANQKDSNNSNSNSSSSKKGRSLSMTPDMFSNVDWDEVRHFSQQRGRTRSFLIPSTTSFSPLTPEDILTYDPSNITNSSTPTSTSTSSGKESSSSSRRKIPFLAEPKHHQAHKKSSLFKNILQAHRHEKKNPFAKSSLKELKEATEEVMIKEGLEEEEREEEEEDDEEDKGAKKRVGGGRMEEETAANGVKGSRAAEMKGGEEEEADREKGTIIEEELAESLNARVILIPTEKTLKKSHSKTLRDMFPEIPVSPTDNNNTVIDPCDLIEGF